MSVGRWVTGRNRIGDSVSREGNNLATSDEALRQAAIRDDERRSNLGKNRNALGDSTSWRVLWRE